MVHPIFRLWFFPLMRALTRSIKGKENVPQGKNFIVVANHEKLADPLFIGYVIMKILDKKIYFLSSTKWWSFFGDSFCREWAGCVPLFDSKHAYYDLKSYINGDRIIGIFPEGFLNSKRRSPKTGAVRLAYETEAAILPMALKSSWIPFNAKISIGKLRHIKSKSFEKEIQNVMNEVYKMRKEL